MLHKNNIEPFTGNKHIIRVAKAVSIEALWYHNIRSTILCTGLLISVSFMLVTVFVYGMFPELRNLNGKSIFCHVSSLTVAYILLAAVQFSEDVSMPICHILAFLIQFYLLTSFFWINIMCFDLWYTFSGRRGKLDSILKKEQDKKLFKYRCMYAFGVPALIVGMTVVMQYYPNPPPNYIVPGFGDKKCWFGDKVSGLVYFYGLITVILIVDVLFFALTLFNILREMNTVGEVIGINKNTKVNRFLLSLKLFFMMEINWIAEVLSFLTKDSSWASFIFDLINSLQGIFIFLIFVCRPKPLSLLKEKFGKLTKK